MDAPKPFEITPKELKEEIFFSVKSDKNNIFDISLKNFSNYLLISANNKNDILENEFENKYFFNDLISNKYFAGFDSIDEIFEQLKFEFKKVDLKLYEEDFLIKIKIPIEFIKVKELIFDLPKKEINETDKIGLLINEVYELKKEINNIKISHEKEINILKEENNNLKNLLNKYIPFLDKIMNINIKETEGKKISNIEDYLSENSLIIKNNIKKQNTIINWIKKKLKKDHIKFELEFRMSENGTKSVDFHKICDDIGPTLILIKTTKNKIFGGFTNLNWKSRNYDSYDELNQTFIFSLDLMKKYDMIDYSKKKAITCKAAGPIFGDWDFGLDYNLKNGSTYANSSCNFLSNENLELTGGEGDSENFQTEEFEVYKVIY